MEAPVLTFKLSIEDTNTVLRALGKLPHDEVHGLIHGIKTTGDAQLQPPPQDKATGPAMPEEVEPADTREQLNG